MQKLKYSFLEKLNHCTAAEIDFIVYASHYQNDHGIISGIYYKEVCKELEISFQKFYDLKESLVEKNVIKINKEHRSDWEIQLINNDFSGKDSFRDGYVNTNHSMFYSKDFLHLKAGEKLLALQFMKICLSGKGRYNIGVEKFFNKYQEYFGVGKRAIQNWLTKLHKFFSIGVKDKQYWITPLVKVYRKNGSKTEIDTYNEHVSKMLCRREKIEYNENQLRDVAGLIKQYQRQFKDEMISALKRAVKKSIEVANKGIRNPKKWVRKLQPKLVHKVLINNEI